MKKGKILLGIICFLTLFTLTGCGKKTAITSDDFKSISENHSYTVVDALSQYAEYDYIDSASIAQSSDKWQVEFYTLSGENYAAGMFDNNKTIFEGYKGNISTESSSSVGNYSNYSLTSGGYFMYICRVDNTLLYVRVEDSYKDTVKDLIKELGY